MMMNNLVKFIEIVVARCNDFTAEKPVVASIKIGYLSACLLNDKYPGSHIPRVQSVFEKCIKTACCNIRQIDRSRTQPTKTAGVFHQMFHGGNIIINAVEIIIRETGTN